ncbi:MAG: dihydroneopterin aldolase [Deltaproteobacteria bacterium]|nr:dihydroneopterin aldolase [Deltaproteobacteria bacterium]
MITIVLRDIGFEGRHGATAIERKSLRKFEADMEVDIDGDSGQRTDRLADTVDYSALAETIVSIGAGEPHRLLESLGRRMLDALEARVPQGRFRLELRKLNPPSCAGHPAFSAVRLQTDVSARRRS